MASAVFLFASAEEQGNDKDNTEGANTERSCDLPEDQHLSSDTSPKEAKERAPDGEGGFVWTSGLNKD